MVTQVVREIFRNGPHKLIDTPIPSPRLYIMLESGFSNWISYSAPDWENEKSKLYMEFSKEAIFEHSYHLAVSKNSKLSFSKLEDLFGKSLILINKWEYFDLDPYLIKFHNLKSLPVKKNKILDIRVHGHKEAIMMLKHGRGDFYMAHLPRIVHAIKEAGYKVEDFKFFDFSKFIKKTGVHLVFDKNLPRPIKKLINLRLKELKKTKKYRLLMKNYHY